MSKSLNVVLAELGYTTEKSVVPYHKRLYKKDEFIGNMSAGQVWNYLRNKHPEYFKKVN